MKGLLLKDYYVMMKTCKWFLFMVVVFLVSSIFADENIFFIIYPCIMSGTIPVSLISIDEQSKWTSYAAAMPYSKEQLVTSKYLMSLILQLTVVAGTAVAQALRLGMSGNFNAQEYFTLLLLVFIMSSMSPVLTLPFVYKFGVEKGRLAYIFMLCTIFISGSVLGKIFKPDLGAEITFNAALPIIALIAAGIYAASWRMSIAFFKKRDLK